MIVEKMKFGPNTFSVIKLHTIYKSDGIIGNVFLWSYSV